MGIDVITKVPSSHRLYRQSPEVPPGEIRWETTPKFDRHINRTGNDKTAHIAHGHVGKFLGIMDCLSSWPIDGGVFLTVSRGAYVLSGVLTVYNPTLGPAVAVTLEAAEDACRDLARNPDLQEASVTYTLEIKDICGP